MQEPLGNNGTKVAAEPEAKATDAHIKQGVLRVKFEPSLGDNLSVQSGSEGLRSGHTAIDNYLSSIGAKRMERVFPYAGKYEARTRKKGLHLWYDIEFDTIVSPLRAMSTLVALPGVKVVEPLYQNALPKSKVRELRAETTRAITTAPFDDPMLPKQWHYHNDGSGQRHVAGSDINLYEAWQTQTGKPNIVVAVIDGGIDVDHEDLKDNMHINQREADGQPGVDDDQNGYVDDVYGYNFVDKSGTITAHKHGTHVAGTVAARNNNGVGVAGVAGGNGSDNSGVRLISCQTFAHTKDAADRSVDAAPAMKYAADAGAIISQNSWGYTYPGPGVMSPSMAAAIDYFIEFAGCDEQGNQRSDSPMKGGVVIFATGNDYMDYRAYPAAYEPVVSVGSFGPDFKLADYSNRGDWVSLIAPGGNDWLADGEVVSTLPDDKYGTMVGTSMACPHVSGIAALVVSQFGGRGFTAEELKSRLVNAVKDRDVNAENPATRGRMGRGYIDAVLALQTKGNKAPDAVRDVTISEDMTGIKLSFKTVSDPDDTKAIAYRIYASATPLTSANYKSASYHKEIYAHFLNVGETITHTLLNLELSTKYFFAIEAEDRWGHTSAPYFFEGTTGSNQLPQLQWGDDQALVRISGQEVLSRTLRVTEPDNQTWEYIVSGEQRGVLVKRSAEGLSVGLRAVAPAGKYRTTIKVVDVYGAATQTDLVFEVYDNTAPGASLQVIEMPTLFVPINAGGTQLKLTDFFVDAEGDPVSFSVRSLADATGATTSIDGATLSVSTSKVGTGTLEVTATDKHGAQHQGLLKVYGVANSLVYRVYPIPATTRLNLDLKRPSKSGSVVIRNTSGTVVLRKDISPGSSSETALSLALDVSRFAPGTYHIEALIDGAKYTQPFVKQ